MLGIKTATVQFMTYGNHETSVELGVSVRGEDVFLIQSGSSSVNDHLMELLIMINACKSASASKITAILPYFPYCKQSKKKKTRGAITAKLVANMLAVAGVDHVITMDLHSSLIQGFFNRPVDNLFAEPSIAKYIKENIDDWERGVVVSKSAGGVKRVTSLADRLNIDFAMIHKDTSNIGSTINKVPAEFLSTNGNSAPHNLEVSNAESMHRNNSGLSGGLQITKKIKEYELTLVGDVSGRVVFILEDMIDNVNSYLLASEFLHQVGAKSVFIICTHGILSGDSLISIQNSKFIEGLIVTNSYPIGDKLSFCSKLNVIDISGVLAEAIRRTHNGESISYLFDQAV